VFILVELLVRYSPNQLLSEALVGAIEHGAVPIIEYLLENGVDVNKRAPVSFMVGLLCLGRAYQFQLQDVICHFPAL
jgi:hypothetical protein